MSLAASAYVTLAVSVLTGYPILLGFYAWWSNQPARPVAHAKPARPATAGEPANDTEHARAA